MHASFFVIVHLLLLLSCLENVLPLKRQLWFLLLQVNHFQYWIAVYAGFPKLGLLFGGGGNSQDYSILSLYWNALTLGNHHFGSLSPVRRVVHHCHRLHVLACCLAGIAQVLTSLPCYCFAVAGPSPWLESASSLRDLPNAGLTSFQFVGLSLSEQ